MMINKKNVHVKEKDLLILIEKLFSKLKRSASASAKIITINLIHRLQCGQQIRLYILYIFFI